MVSGLTFKSLIHFELTCIWSKIVVQFLFSFFAYVRPVFPTLVEIGHLASFNSLVGHNKDKALKQQAEQVATLCPLCSAEAEDN